jgi:hypothetical protein
MEKRRVFGTALSKAYQEWCGDAFQRKTEEEVHQLMTSLPFYPLRKSLEILPLIRDAEI